MAKDAKPAEKKRDWYGGSEGASAEAGKQETETTESRHSRERAEMFGRHSESVSTLLKQHEKEAAAMMERHVSEAGMGGPGGPEATPVDGTGGNAMSPAKA